MTNEGEESLVVMYELGNTHQEDEFPKTPDNDPKDFYGHGTHVAGIIAAENEW